MNKVLQYFLVGIVVAVGGFLVTNLMAQLLNFKMDYGTAYVVSVCMYLSVVVVTCTGVIVTKLDSIAHSVETHDKEND